VLVIAFDYSTDFSKAFDKFKRALAIIFGFMFFCFYLHSSELHAQVFDKLLQAFTTSELVAQILRYEEWLMLIEPPTAPF